MIHLTASSYHKRLCLYISNLPATVLLASATSELAKQTTMWWTVAGVLGAILCVIYLFFTWHFNRWKSIGVKGPKPRILYGDLPSIFTKKNHLYYEYEKVYK